MYKMSPFCITHFIVILSFNSTGSNLSMEKTFKIIHFCLEKVFGINLFEPIDPKQRKVHYFKRFVHISSNVFIFSCSLWDLLYNEKKRFIDRALLMCICPGIFFETCLFLNFLSKLNKFRDNIDWIRGRYLRRSIEVIERYSHESYRKSSKMIEKTVV